MKNINNIDYVNNTVGFIQEEIKDSNLKIEHIKKCIIAFEEIENIRLKIDTIYDSVNEKDKTILDCCISIEKSTLKLNKIIKNLRDLNKNINLAI